MKLSKLSNFFWFLFNLSIVVASINWIYWSKHRESIVFIQKLEPFLYYSMAFACASSLIDQKTIDYNTKNLALLISLATIFIIDYALQSLEIGTFPSAFLIAFFVAIWFILSLLINKIKS